MLGNSAQTSLGKKRKRKRKAILTFLSVRKEEAGPPGSVSSSAEMSDLIARTSLASLGLGKSQASKPKRRGGGNVPPGHQLHEIGRNDTLAGIAMKYGSSVEDLKKLNQLWSERDMYSRLSLVVPIFDEDAGGLMEQRSAKVREFLQLVGEGKENDEVSASRWLSKAGWSVEKAVNAYHDHVEEERRRVLERSPPPRQMLNSSYSSAEEELGDPTGFYGMADGQKLGGSNRSEDEFGVVSNEASFFEL